jgi:dipeptidase D
MTDVLDRLEPALLWRHFATLTATPRPSRGEDAALALISDWARERGFEVASAGGRNLLVRIPATAGRAGAPTVVLQSHVDMVCERSPDSAFDPALGRIGFVRDGDWLKADGTTLGADNGMGVSAMMAAADDPSVAHGPLELLFTVAEEVGLEGAKSIDGSTISGRVMLNLDSEEDGRLTTGCAGSTDTFLRLDMPRDAVGAADVALSVAASGGLGGHSGTNIAQGRANAIKVLARCLREALAEIPFRLAALDGGKSRNAIPRDARAVVLVAEGDADALRAALQKASAVVSDAFALTDPGVGLTLEATDRPPDAWPAEATRTIIDAIVGVPSGMVSLSPDFPGLVEMSTSLGTAISQEAELELHSLTRTSNESALPDVLGALGAVAALAGGTLEVNHGYAGWRPNLKSPVLATCRAVWSDIFGEEPIVTAVHAGLETALVGEKVPGLDMISIGPQIESPHSPDERVSIPTVERFWMFLAGVLDRLSA